MATQENTATKEEPNLDDLALQLYDDCETTFDEDLATLKFLEEQREKIGNHEALGEVVRDIIWEQFQSQIGIQAGKDFIEKNRGNTLDLRPESHIQTTEDFEKGKIATHNDQIDYQQRYDGYQSNFQKDEDGNIKTYTDRTGKEQEIIAPGARDKFDKDRPKGSREKGTDMDHTISAAEMMRDPAAYAHLDQDEIIEFANSDVNLNEMPSDQNRSKGDKSMTDWLDNPNANGQKPEEIFPELDEETKNELLEKDRQAREEYEKLKKQGEERSKQTGRQSQINEALRISEATLKSAVLSLCEDFVKEIVSKLVDWLRSTERKLGDLINSVKAAIDSFIQNLKQKLINTTETVLTTIATSILGPIVNTIKKVWILLKKGWQAIKAVIKYLCSEEAKKHSFKIKLLNVGKIIIGILTATGAIVLGEIIEKGLMTIPVFNIQIPVLGSLANILGIFFGAVIAGIIGAIALNFINKLIAKKEAEKIEVRMAFHANDAMHRQITRTLRALESAYTTL